MNVNPNNPEPDARCERAMPRLTVSLCVGMAVIGFVCWWTFFPGPKQGPARITNDSLAPSAEPVVVEGSLTHAAVNARGVSNQLSAGFLEDETVPAAATAPPPTPGPSSLPPDPDSAPPQP